MEEADRLDDLIQRYLDGGVSAAEHIELDRLLLAHPQSAATFAEAVQFDQMLETCLTEQQISAAVDKLLARFGAAETPAYTQSTVARGEGGRRQTVDGSDSRPPSTIYRLPSSRSRVLGFLNGLLHISGDTPLAAALMWVVMAILCSGMILTIVLCILLVFRGVGVNVHVDAPQVAKSGEQGAGSREQGSENKRSDLPADSSLPAPSSLPRPSATVARFVQAYDCHWAIGSHSPHPGDDLEPGRKLVLLSGLAEIMFESGVRTVLQGPATLDVASKSSAFLRQGRLTVTVIDPDARGFEIGTPGMKYTDLGTEFGVFVAKDGAQEMHVFRGRVQAEAAGSAQNSESGTQNSVLSAKNSELSTPAPLILSAHQAVRIVAPDKPIERFAADEKQFVRAERMAEIVAESSPDFRRWKKFHDELCNRSDLVAYYDFQPDGADLTVLRNRAASGARFDGKVAGAEWTSGRFPSKKALRFRNQGNGVRVSIPVDCPQITLAAWVNLDRFSKGLVSLIDSDGWARPGAVHWQLSKAGGTKLGICCVGDTGEQSETGIESHSTAVFSRDRLARWCFTVVTCDTTTGNVAYYFNGDCVTDASTGDIERNTPAANLGNATIGAWDVRDFKDSNPDRSMQGRMDELMIFNTSLSAKAIRQIYDAGRVQAGGRDVNGE